MVSDFSDQIQWPKSGKYLVAVSGGVDSMALLDLLVARDDLDLEIGHFNHGWSAQADDFEEVVLAASKKYDLALTIGRKRVVRSEAAARRARYECLKTVKSTIGAIGIITAHHKDDLVETMALNLLRGTGRRGLTPFAGSDLIRPLVKVGKNELIKYAHGKNLTWVEDRSNLDTSLRRNQIRHEVLSASMTDELMRIFEQASKLNESIDRDLHSLFLAEKGKSQANLKKIRDFDFAVLTELLVLMIQVAQPGAEVDSRTIEALARDIKIGKFKRPRQLTNALLAEYSHGTVTIVFSP